LNSYAAKLWEMGNDEEYRALAVKMHAS